MPTSEQPWIPNETMDQNLKTSVASKAKTSRTGATRKPAVNQTLSCAECRRLKLRCDRVFPCGSCQKRGIAELCPEGSLPTRNKPPASLTDKEQLYQQLSELRGRILELESALEVAHAQVSPEPHPLLSGVSFKRKIPNKRKKQSQREGLPEDEMQADSEDSESLDEALGSLHMDSEGHRSKYLGRSACVERLFRYQKESSLTQQPSEPSILVSSEVAMLYQSFPFLTLGEATNLIQERIWQHLPPLDRAQGLRENYRRHIYHFTDIIPADGWFEDLFWRVYAGTLDNISSPSFSERDIRVDELALMFAYFALGALVDLELTPFNYEAEAYACLARSALTSMNIMQNATIISIETLILLAYFEEMWGKIIGSGDAWMLTAFATKLAQSMGLHRNSSKLGLESCDAERRSKVYWELYSLELLECLAHGRPATFVLVPTDVAMPKCSQPETNLHNFRYRFAVECLTPLIRQAFGLRAPPYNLVVELDRKIRKLCSEHGIGLTDGQHIEFARLDETSAMESYVKLVHRESALLYLHRTFFVRAVSSNPADPQHTRYGLSVSGAYDSATTLVQTASEFFQTYPVTMSRALLCWTHTLCSAFVLATVAIHCPSSRLAPLAAKRLDDENDLYHKASIYGGRAMADSYFVSRLAERSHNAIQAYAEFNRHSRNSNNRSFDVRSVVTKQELEDDIDELGVLGGHTRLIKTRKDTPASSANQSVYSPSQRQLSPGVTDTSSQSDSSAFMHDKSPLWTTEFKHAGEEGRAVSGDPEYRMSPNGSVASGMSPLSSVPAHYSNEGDHYQSAVLSQGIDTYSEGGTFRGGVPDYVQIPNGTMPYDMRNVQVVGVNGQAPYYADQVDYSPMDVSADPRDWNFLDDWYGHIFSLDVIPPDYGKDS